MNTPTKLSPQKRAWNTMRYNRARDAHFARERLWATRPDRWKRSYVAHNRGYQLPGLPSATEIRDYVHPADRATWDYSPRWSASYVKPDRMSAKAGAAPHDRHGAPIVKLKLTKVERATLVNRPVIFWEPEAAKWLRATRGRPAVVEPLFCPVDFKAAA